MTTEDDPVTAAWNAYVEAVINAENAQRVSIAAAQAAVKASIAYSEAINADEDAKHHTVYAWSGPPTMCRVLNADEDAKHHTDPSTPQEDNPS